jgi:aconitate hydratase
MLENLLRPGWDLGHRGDIEAVARWDRRRRRARWFRPAQSSAQDFTGVPVVADLAAMRDAVARMEAPGG